MARSAAVVVAREVRNGDLTLTVRADYTLLGRLVLALPDWAVRWWPLGFARAVARRCVRVTVVP